MSNSIVTRTVQDVLESSKGNQIKDRFKEILGKRSAGFISSIINISNSPTLKDSDGMSVISSAVVAATLDLPIDPNIGFAYVVPFNCKDKNTSKWIKKAQFQLGYRGYVQLALRTGQYKNINVVEIYKGQIKSWNPLTEELKFDFENKESDKVIGYAGFFKLVNGFEKTVYWSKKEVEYHAEKYSKTYKTGPWKDNFDEMAKKTVLKDMIKKWGILSIEMQSAVKADQAIVKDSIINNNDIDNSLEYVDNPGNATEVEYSEVKKEIKEEANKEIIDVEPIEIKKDDSKKEKTNTQDEEAPY